MVPLTTLDDLRGESPCPLDWDQLAGGDRVRHCSACGRDVLNLSALTAEEAARALADPATGCVRLQRRADGRAVLAEPPGRARALAVLAFGLVLSVAAGCADSSPKPDSEGCMKRDSDGNCTQWMGKR